MKFVFALALVCLYVALMRARPNVDINKREVGDGNGKGNGHTKHPLDKYEESEVKKEEDHEKAEDRESAEAEHQKDEKSEVKKEEDHEKAEAEESAEAEHQNPSRKRRAAFEPDAKLWPKPVIPYCFEPKDGRTPIDDETKKLFREAAAEWKEKSGVEFKEDCSAEDAIIVYKGTGCWSYIGYQVKTNNPDKGNQICLGAGCGDKGVILHELGHAVGLMHEAKRFDRDTKIKTNNGNVKDNMISQFTKNSKKPSLMTPYDVCSIMHYGQKAFSKNDGYTIEGKDDITNPCMGSQQAVTLRDGYLVAKAYKFLDTDSKGEQCKWGGYRLKTSPKCVCSNLLQGDLCEEPLVEEGGKIIRHPTERDRECGDNRCVIEIKEYGLNGKQVFGLHHYENDLTIVWVIKSKLEGTVCTKFPKFHVDQGFKGTCPWDWLQIVNDEKETINTMRKCDQQGLFYVSISKPDKEAMPDDFRGAFVFHSDAEYKDVGFNAEVILLKGKDKSKQDCEDAFKGKVDEESGTKGGPTTNLLPTNSDKKVDTGGTAGGATDSGDWVYYDYYDYYT